MKNAIIPNNAMPPATDSPMMEPVPSPEFSSPFGGELGVGVLVLLPEAETVTMMTVFEPSDPVLSTLLTCAGGGVGEFVCGGGVEVGLCGVEVGEGVLLVEVTVFVCDGVSDVVVDVEVGVEVGDEGRICERS